MSKKIDSDVEHYVVEVAKELLKKNFAQYDSEQVTYALREILLFILTTSGKTIYYKWIM